MKECFSCGQQWRDAGWRCPVCHKEPPLVDGYRSFASDLAKENDNFDPGFFALLAKLEAGNFWFRSRNRLLFWAMKKYFPHAATFLEIGCGTGFVLEGFQQALPHLELYGSELLSRGLDFAAARAPAASLFQMDACRIPFREEFDVLGAFDVLEHINDDEAVLHEMHKACRPGGGIMLTVPQHRFLWSVVDEQSFHKRRYTPDDLARKLTRAGFTVIRSTSFVSLLTPLMLLSRRKRQLVKNAYDPTEELKLGPFLNKIAYVLLTLERWAIAGGLSFPFGGSLLVVARRKDR